ncbi:MAG: universal stress protein [Nakamurella sp.]
MTTNEVLRASADARRAAGASSATVSQLENAMHTYLSATTWQSLPFTRDAAATAPTAAARPRTTGFAVAGAADVNRFLVVAGIDGSSCSRRAAGWAAAEAVHRHGSLLLVHAYSLPSAGYSGYNPYPANLLPQLREEGEALLDDTANALRLQYPTLAVDTRMSYGDPATVLRHASAAAQLTVVGARGGHRVVSALGSVAVGIASTNPGPVVVIHPAAPSAPTGPVVVGVDGSPTSDAALGYAFEAAALRQVPLVAVHCWTDPVLVGDMPYYAAGIVDTAHIATERRAFLAETLAPWSSTYPNVVVQQVVIHGRPTPALLESSRTAQLTVVGSHGQHGRTGWVGARYLLGSTSVALITNSPSPVVVVRTSSAG